MTTSRNSTENVTDRPHERRTHESLVVWNGGLQDGEGRFELGSGSITGYFDLESRDGRGFHETPQEMLAAALAMSFTLALMETLEPNRCEVETIQTQVEIRMCSTRDRRRVVDDVLIRTRGDVRAISSRQFASCAESALEVSLRSLALPAGHPGLEAVLIEYHDPDPDL